MKFIQRFLPNAKELYQDELTVFNMVLVFKVIYGFLKIGLGITFLFFKGAVFGDVFHQLMAHELHSDPTDTFISLIDPFIIRSPLVVTTFLASYFIFWGCIDFFLSLFLLQKKIWAYPLVIFFISLFIVYELFRFSHNHSLILLLIIVIDIFIVWFTVREWGRRSK